MRVLKMRALAHGALVPRLLSRYSCKSLHHLLRQPRARLVQRQHDAGDLQRRVDALGDQGRRLQQLAHAVQGQEVRLQRNEHLVGRRQGVERQHAQRRGAVHEDEVEGAFVLQQQVAQDHLAADDAGQLDLGGGQVDVGAGHPEVVLDLAAHLGQRPGVDQHVVHRRRLAVGLDAEVGGGVGLRVEVEHADALAALGQGRRQVDRRGRLADAALLIDDRDPSHGESSTKCPSVTIVNNPGLYATTANARTHVFVMQAARPHNGWLT